MRITRVSIEEDDMGNETGLLVAKEDGTRHAVSFGGGSNMTTLRMIGSLENMIEWLKIKGE